LGERTGVPLIHRNKERIPQPFYFDSLKAAKARGSDVLIVDTAGRLPHTKSNLMPNWKR